MNPDAETIKIFQCNSLHHKPRVDFPRNKPPIFFDKPSTNRLRDGTVYVTVKSAFIPVFNLALDHEDALSTTHSNSLTMQVTGQLTATCPLNVTFGGQTAYLGVFEREKSFC
jgi:hypothetical protein